MTPRRLAILAEALRFGTVRRVGQTMPFEALVAAGLLEPAEHFMMYRASAEGVRAYGVAVGTHTED